MGHAAHRSAPRRSEAGASCRAAGVAQNGRMLGVIGGSGFYTFFGSGARILRLATPYGAPSAPITLGTVGEHGVAFMARPGGNHQISPHTRPERAELRALRA